MSGAQRKIKLVITDLDDTLWRWPLMYVEPYRRMLLAISIDFNIPFEQLVKEVQDVHRLHRDTEYPLSILEIDSIKEKYPHSTLEERYTELKQYLDLFELVRQESLSVSLFGPVHETLGLLRKQGIPIISYTDANAYAVTHRLHAYGLEKFIDKIYCRGRHDLKGEIYRSWHEALESVGHHKLVLVDKELAKPQPEIIRRILADFNEGLAANDKVKPSEVLYIGDSLERDMKMVQNFNQTYCQDGEIGITAVHAQYGRQNDRACEGFIAGITREELMKFMMTISYWSEEQNRREAHSEANHHAIERRHTLLNHFGELLSLEPFAAAQDELSTQQSLEEAALSVSNQQPLLYARDTQKTRALAVGDDCVARLDLRP